MQKVLYVPLKTIGIFCFDIFCSSVTSRGGSCDVIATCEKFVFAICPFFEKECEQKSTSFEALIDSLGRSVGESLPNIDSQATAMAFGSLKHVLACFLAENSDDYRDAK